MRPRASRKKRSAASKQNTSRVKRPAHDARTVAASVNPLPAFPVVGIGASAGGLEAFTQLLSCLPSDTGMAFVLIQHLDPQHDSLCIRFATAACLRVMCAGSTRRWRARSTRYGHKRPKLKVVYLVDGAVELWNLFDGYLKRPLGPNATNLVDFWHGAKS
jgi:CheB methylesterase